VARPKKGKKKGGKKHKGGRSSSSRSTPTASPPKKDPLFQLIIENTEQADANMAFRWCLSEDALAKLREAEVNRPHLLVVVTRRTSGTKIEEVGRHLFDLGDGMRRIVFKSPGDYMLHAAVVWSAEADHKEAWSDLHNRYINTGHGNFRKGLVDGEAFRHDNLGNYRLDHLDETRVHVSEEFFAKERMPWMMWYANVGHHKDPLRDDCHFRKRFWVLGLPKLPFVILYSIVMVLIRSLWTLTLLGCGWRHVNWRAIIRPFAFSITDVHDTLEAEYELWDSRGMYTKTSAGGRAYSMTRWILTTPVILVALGLASWGIVEVLVMYGPMAVEEFGLGWLALVFVAILITSTVVAEGSTRAWDATEPARQAWVQSHEAATRERAVKKTERKEATTAKRIAQARTRLIDERLAPLVCKGDQVADPSSCVSVEALPRTHRTLALRAAEFKANVCRPFKQ